MRAWGAGENDKKIEDIAIWHVPWNEVIQVS
jgi:hypothetical protein